MLPLVPMSYANLFIACATLEPKQKMPPRIELLLGFHMKPTEDARMDGISLRNTLQTTVLTVPIFAQ